MRCTYVFLSATVAMGVAACSQDSSMSERPSLSERVSNVTANSSVAQDMNTTTNMSDFERSAGRTPVPVVVEGSAFGLDRTALERQVANDMKGAYWGPRANFVPAFQARTMPEEPEYLVVMMLSPATQPARQVTGAQLCADQYRVSAVGAPGMSGTNTNAATGPGAASGGANPAMRNAPQDTVDRPATIGREDEMRTSSTGRTTAGSTSATRGTTSSSRAATTSSRSAAASSRARSSAAGRSNVHLVSALCRYDQAVKQVDTRATNISGPSDPAFHNLIVNATNQLTQPVPEPSDRPAGPGQER